MEARLDRQDAGQRNRQYGPTSAFAGRSPLFSNVRKRRRIGQLSIEIPQINPVSTALRLIRTDIGQTEAGGLDRHQPARRLDGGVASAALHIVGALPPMELGNAGEIGKQLCVFFKNIPIHPLPLAQHVGLVALDLSKVILAGCSHGGTSSAPAGRTEALSARNAGP